MSNFDEIIDRADTRALKVERCSVLFNRKDVLPLWVADMDFAAPPAVQKALKQRIEHPIYGYTVRPESFFDSIREWQMRRHNWSVENSWIEFSPGVVPSLGLAVQAFTQPGEGVIIQPPVYPPFFGVINDFNRKVVENNLVEKDDHYEIDFDHFETMAADDNNKLFLLCHPHNPVGREWSEEELRRMGEICVRHNVIIISDEIHCDLTLFGHKHIPLATVSPSIADITVTCMAPSKTFNLAGFSTSYFIASNTRLLKAMRQQLFGYHLHMGNTFGALALEAAYNHSEEWLDELREYLEGNVMLMHNFLTEHLPEVKMVMPEATYLLWLDFRAWSMSQSDLKRFMTDKAGLGLNDGSTFGRMGEGFMRMNVASPRRIVEKALIQLRDARKEFLSEVR
ncbi:MalY/PatB family protein [Geofilum sp. OHC36d9]|uniref:MalY/PatB family protein n=1 Tax=Geofilum sp. OHC36d9 TaxID=3458413 RepID=UPI004034ACC3